MPDPIQQLRAVGQSVWLDFIRRGIITDGQLEQMVSRGWVSGVTSNPTIFQRAIAGSADYDDALRRAAGRGLTDPYEAYIEVFGEDIRMATDVLRPVYESSQGVDGYVSFEAQAASTEEMVAEGRRMWRAVGRPNLMIKIPGIPEGVSAVETLISEGINVNVTLLFDVDVYAQFAEAYIRGLERRLEAGQPVDGLAGVASFFVSRVDTKADALLAKDSPLRGKLAVANAWRAYKLFLDTTALPRWQRLAAAGARLQRPLWASTSTKDPAYSDVLYVEELVAPDTVNTLPEATIKAFLDHGKVASKVDEHVRESETQLRDAAAAGIDLKAIAAELIDDGVDAFNKDFEKLLDEIGRAIARVSGGRVRESAQLGELDATVASRLDAMAKDDVLRRIWAGEHTVWSADPTEITAPNRLGWLRIVDEMRPHTDDLRRFAAEVTGDGYASAVLCGMGGSSLAPEVFARIFVPAAGGFELSVLDTTDPAQIVGVERSLDLSRTLFIISSKSGTTIETTSQLAYFWEKVPDGRHFIAITDPGTPLAALGRERGFRRVFVNSPDLGGRYSALSYFGLVPAALVGVDFDALLESAGGMAEACSGTVAPAENAGAWLGAVIGEAALAGRDKLTLVLPDELAPFGDWVEQLIAESTGKEGKGIVPIVGEGLGPPEVYGPDRLFVAYGDVEGLGALEGAGQPVVRLPRPEGYALGGEFYRWQFATAVAGHVLGINPFDQPDVQAAKDAAARFLAKPAADEANGARVGDLLTKLRPGDYIALLAYLPRREDTYAELSALRHKLRDRFGVTTTLGFGPRYLHSTGQLHKGGPKSGVFIVVTSDDETDMPVPGRDFSFGRLERAQWQGDYDALRSTGRRVVRLSLPELHVATR